MHLEASKTEKGCTILGLAMKKNFGQNGILTVEA